MPKVDNPEIETQVLTLLKETNMPVSIDWIRYHLGVQWGTARALLLSMVIDGKIVGLKTSKSWVFLVKKEEGG